MLQKVLENRVDHALATLVLAHGAGAPMDSEFMNLLVAALNRESVSVLRFEFPYMQRRRNEGVKAPPDRQARLLHSFQEILEQVGEPEKLFIGGKSMGGRMASILATALPVQGVCCFGYPFHPPGKADKLRTAHFGELLAPCLILQGTRDPFGKQDEIEGMVLPKSVSVHWLDTGNHDFMPTRRSGLGQKELIQQAAQVCAAFMRVR